MSRQKSNSLSKGSQKVLMKVLTLICDNHLYARQIAKELNLTKQSISYRIKQLKSLGLIQEVTRDFIKVYEPTSKGIDLLKSLSYDTSQKDLSLGDDTNIAAVGSLQHPITKPTYSVHNFSITIPIIKKGNIKFDKINLKLKNNIQKILHIDDINANIVETTQSIVVHLGSRHIKSVNEIPPLYHSLLAYINIYLKRYGYELNTLRARCSNPHIAIQDSISENLVSHGVKIELPLARKTAKILSEDVPKEAKVWLDSTPFNNLETNDYLYAQNYMLMPERIKDMSDKTENRLNQFENALNLLGKEIEQHLGLVQDWRLEVQKSSKVDILRPMSKDIESIKKFMKIQKTFSKARQTELLEFKKENKSCS